MDSKSRNKGLKGTADRSIATAHSSFARNVGTAA